MREEPRCRHMGYAFRLTARVLLYAPSHRQDNTYHGLCYTSRGALAGTRNIINDESGNNNGNDGRTTVNKNKPYVKECINSMLQCNDLFNGQIKYYLKIYIFDLSLYFRNIIIYVTTMSHLLTINNRILATHHKSGVEKQRQFISGKYLHRKHTNVCYLIFAAITSKESQN